MRRVLGEVQQAVSEREGSLKKSGPTSKAAEGSPRVQRTAPVATNAFAPVSPVASRPGTGHGGVAQHIPRSTTDVLDLQRSVGNRATVSVLGDRASGTPMHKGLAVQRLFGNKKAKAKPNENPAARALLDKLGITVDDVPALMTKISQTPEMKSAADLRAVGLEDQALNVTEKLWDSGTVELGSPPGVRVVKLAELKPLLFTTSERRLGRIRRWKQGVNANTEYENAVKRGDTTPTTPLKKKDGPSPTETAGDVVGSIGDIGQTVTNIGYTGSEIGSSLQDKSSTPSPSTTGDTLREKIDIEGSKELKSMLDTHKLDPNSSSYVKPSLESKSDWAGGIISMISSVFSIVSGVGAVIKKASSKEASKREVAEEVSGLLSSLVSSANSAMQFVQEFKGSEIVTHAFHWVPGLSIMSGVFTSVQSGLALVPRAVQLHVTRNHSNELQKERKNNKNREDLSFAVDRLWSRAGQQVEQESFAVAKSLTNTGLAVAEVATAGGFGIPTLAKGVIAAAGALHSFGHAIADNVRAVATKKSRLNFLKGKSGSAEKLIRKDPSAAADTVITRALEGDPQALTVLKAYDIDVKSLGGNMAPSVRPLAGVPGDYLDYEDEHVKAYADARKKLLKAMSESDTPETISDKVKGGLATVKSMPGNIRDRWRDANRLKDVRNELDDKDPANVGKDKKTPRTRFWAFRKFFKGFEKDGEYKKLTDKTAKDIKEKHSAGTLSEEDRTRLLGVMTPEWMRREEERYKEEAKRPKPSISLPVNQAALQRARGLGAGELSGIIQGGKAQLFAEGGKEAAGTEMQNDAIWEAYMQAFSEKFSLASSSN